MSFLSGVWFEIVLGVAVSISTIITVFICSLPSTYSAHQIDALGESHFDPTDRKNPQRSGFAYFQQHKNDEGKLETPVTVDVLVLGDIGRSPRMQYHALSIAAHGGRVNLIGYTESDIHPDIIASRLITILPIRPYPKLLQTNSRGVFLLVAPLKVLWQIWSLYYVLGYGASATKWMLVQNPPSIPALAVSQFICFFRNTRLIIDWHNFGYSILALRLGQEHPLVKVSEWYEGFFSRSATAHFAVTNAMCKVLENKWKIVAQPLHDRPPEHFQPLSKQTRSAFLSALPDTAQYAPDIIKGTWRLIVSSTSWTPDEDFSILLDALAAYSAIPKSTSSGLPKILAIITGKGPQKEYYMSRIQQMNQAKQLQNVVITSAWLSTSDYASLLGAADLGISLHCSSSGVDLPMKVVDMFGTGLPVAGYSAFEAWPELVQEGKNGRGFSDSNGLKDILENLFSNPSRLETLRQGALKECQRRWDNEWLPVAGKLFQLRP